MEMISRAAEAILDVVGHIETGTFDEAARDALYAALDPSDHAIRVTILQAMGFVSESPGVFSPYAHAQAQAAIAALRSALPLKTNGETTDV